MTKELDLDFFVVDLQDIPAPITEEIEKENDAFIERVKQSCRAFDTIKCDCYDSNTKLVMDVSGENIILKPEDEVDEEDLVLKVVSPKNDPDDTTKEDKDEASDFSYKAVVESDDAKFTRVVALIRRCNRCGDIRIRGDLESICKIIGYSYVNELDYEQQEEKQAAACSGNCASCQSCMAESTEEDSSSPDADATQQDV